MKEVAPEQTKRALAFELWMKAPMPMITIFKVLDVKNLVKLCRKQKNYKFNMLMCWCIGKAASQTEEFYLLPVGSKLIQYDHLAISVVVPTKDGGISTCDVPFSPDVGQFRQAYLQLTKQVYETSAPHNLEENYMVIGTSALAQYDIAGAVNIYAGFYNNPFMIWGKYQRRFLKTTLTASFQFHHTQIDGIPAAQFLDCVQDEIEALTTSTLRLQT